MPKGYEDIRDRFIAQGMSRADAQKHAAMIWNAHHHGSQAVGRGSDRTRASLARKGT